MNTEEAIMQHIVRYLNGEATVAERELVDTWKKTSTDNYSYFEEVATVWKNTESAKDFESINIDQQWDRFVTETSIDKSETPVLSLQNLWKVAAAIVVLIGLTFYFKSTFNNEITLMAASDQENRFVLPDGSKVWLNDGSQLSYTKDFGGKESAIRSLKLKGEAYFEVVKNPNKPFEVVLNNTKTQVLGTSFNLKEDAPNKSVSLALLTGKVAFSTATAKEIVHPGEQIQTEADGTLSKTKTEGKNFLAWKTGILTFDNSPLKKALQDISDFYKITVVMNEEQIKHCKLTTTFHDETLEDVLETLKILFSINYNKSSKNKYELTGGGC